MFYVWGDYMEIIIPLFLTFIAGLFITLGALIAMIVKNNKKFIHFSISMAFGVIVSLISLELLPETKEILCEHFGNLGYVLLIVCVVVGVLILKILDLFIPDHEQHGTTKKAELDNLYHIGVVSSIALILHNVIEGMSIYGITSNSLEMGLMMTLGVGFHNIPMGIVITSMFNHSIKNKRTKFILILGGISLSTLLGGLLMLLLSNFINEIFIGILLGLTLGMLLYILLFELLHELFEYKDKKISIVGVIIGILIFSLSMGLHHHHH